MTGDFGESAKLLNAVAAGGPLEGQTALDAALTRKHEAAAAALRELGGKRASELDGKVPPPPPPPVDARTLTKRAAEGAAVSALHFWLARAKEGLVRVDDLLGAHGVLATAPAASLAARR